MADITLTKEVLTKIINDNPSSTIADIFEILINDKNNTYRTAVSPISGTGGGILKTSSALVSQLEKFKLNKKLILKKRFAKRYDPETMTDLGRYLESLYKTKGKMTVAGSYQNNTFYNFLNEAVKNAEKKDPITFNKNYTGEKLYNAIRLYTPPGSSKQTFPNLRKSANSWANFEGKGLIGLDELSKFLKPVEQGGFKKSSIIQYLLNAEKTPTPNLRLKDIEVSKRFKKTLEEAGVTLTNPIKNYRNEPNAFSIKNIDYEKLSQIGKISPSVARNLRQEIVRYSKASKEFNQFGGLADFRRLEKTRTTLRQILNDNFGSKINTSPELVKTQLLDFLDNNKMLKRQISLDFDGRKFFQRNLNDESFTAKTILDNMMPDIDHAKTIKQISGNTSSFKNVNKGDAALSETMLNKTLVSNYFNTSLKNKIVNTLIDTNYDPALVADVEKNLKGTGAIIKGADNKFIGDALNPIISKQVERMGLLDDLQKGAPKLIPELDAQSNFVKDFYKNLNNQPKASRRLVEAAVGCTINRAEGGRINMVEGGSTSKCVDIKLNRDPEGFMKKVASIEETSGPINKIKNFASTFLNVAKKGGRFGAFAAAGAATAGLVKEFRNDDPSTYLSNEDQQKNMLIDMLTQPVSTPLEEKTTAFGDAQLPAIGAVTAAGMVPGGAELYRQRTGSGVRKGPLGGPRLDADKLPIPKNRVSPFRAALGPLSGVLGKGLATTGTPLGMLALEPLYIGQQIADGDSAGEIATNPLNYLGPAFAGSLSKEATRFAGPTMSNIMRLGISPTTLKTVSRRFGIPGLALSAGMSGYEMYQNKKAGRGLFDDG